MPDISDAQYKVLDLFRDGSFNDLNARSVVTSLLENATLWKSAMPNCDGGISLWLRDLAGGYHHYDTLYILTDQEHAADLIALAHTWGADEVDICAGDDWADRWVNLEMALGKPGAKNPNVVIRVWWD